MLTLVTTFLASLGISVSLIPAIKGLASRWRLMDRGASSRNIHAAPLPRLGGVAIVVAFYAPLAGLVFHQNPLAARFLESRIQAFALLAGGLLIFGLGLVDDLRRVRTRTKFTFQFGVAALLYYYGFRISQIDLPFFGHFPLGALALPLTLVWIVGLINAFNLIDGLDGLAGGVAFFSALTIFVIAITQGDFLMSLYMAALSGGVLGFLIFNFNPASIFMGDCGSMFLGYILSVTALQTSQKGTTTVAILVPIIALGLPIMDTLLSMVRRFLSGRSMFSADREHIHHRLLALGLTQRRAVLLLYGLCLFLGAVALALRFATEIQSALLLIVVATVVAVLVRMLGFARHKGPQPSLTEMRGRNLNLRAAVREAGEQIRQAQSLTDVWEILQQLAPTLGAAELKLELRTPSPVPGRRQVALYGWQMEDGQASTLSEVKLPVGNDNAGYLSVVWKETGVDRDREIALEVLSDHVTSVLEHLRQQRAGDPNVIHPITRKSE